MKILNLIQGSPEWHAHRAQHWNASDAPAMLGTSTNKKRSELLREVATGVAREFSDFVQERIIDVGHAFEDRARALAEQIIGEELYACVGAEGRLSASFDGLTLLEDVAWEHKRLNQDLREAMFEGCTGADLPEMYRVQMEHQAIVSGAKTVLFMASEWRGDELVEERHCWYNPDPALAARIVAGWSQFEADLATYKPEQQAAPAATGRAPEQLPALLIEVTGMVTNSNLEAWKNAAVAVFKGISTDLQTDQDFADAAKTVKWCGDIEDSLKAAKNHALAQTQSIDVLFRTIDAISEEARQTRLKLDKLVEARKAAIRTEIVERGRLAVVGHYDAINATLGAHALQLPAGLVSDLGQAIKGRKTVDSLNDAVDSAVANFKIAASQRAEQVRANIHAFEMEIGDYGSLFPDRVQLCASKAPEDLRNLIVMRISEHKEAVRVRQEKAAEAKPAPAAAPEPTPASTAVQQMHQGRSPVVSTAKIKLGDLNARIAPITVTADGLSQIGFPPASKERGATLYRESDFHGICEGLAQVLCDAAQKKAA